MTPAGWYLLGAPWDCSGTDRGESRAPAALRAAGLADLVDQDLGDAATQIDSTVRDPGSGVLALPETVRAAEALADALTGALVDVRLAGKRPLVVGGDCSILLGIYPALGRAIGPVGLWFVDGHPDYLDGRGSDTGETADMDLAVLTGTGADELVFLAGPPPMVPLDAAVLLGHRARDLDEGSQDEVGRLPAELRSIDADTVLADPAAAGARAAEWLAAFGQGVWLHVDLDVLDSAALPAVTYPLQGGPDWDQLAALLGPLAGSPRLVGVSIADFRPDLDPTGTHAHQLVQLLATTLP